MSLALILSGGAPNMTIMSGALLALDEWGIEFDTISATGAGMLIGLLYAAPKGGNRRDALRATRELGISDEIYRLFPVDYKVFHKPGKHAVAYTRAMRPWLDALPSTSPFQRFCKDWAHLASAVLCPSDLNPASGGLCQAPPWISDMVDFDDLKAFPGEFHICAYSVDRGELRSFRKEEITADHFNASLAMPFIYPPYKINGETFIEGSALNPLHFDPLLRPGGRRVDCAVVFDILGHRKLIHPPRSLYDSYVQSIIVPLVHLAELEAKNFAHTVRERGDLSLDMLTLDFADLVPEAHWPEVLDWSYSNLTTLFDIGYRAGHRLVEQNKPVLLGHAERAATIGSTVRRPINRPLHVVPPSDVGCDAGQIATLAAKFSEDELSWESEMPTTPRYPKVAFSPGGCFELLN